MFKFFTIFIHCLYLLAITVIMVGAEFSVAAPDTERNYGVLYILVLLVMLIIAFSWCLNLRLRRVWILLISFVAIPFIFQYAIHLSLVFGY